MPLSVVSSDKKNISAEEHYRIEEHDDHIQVFAAGKSYRYTFSRKEFEKRYLENWRKIRITCPAVEINGEKIAFSKQELFYIKQRIILNWIRGKVTDWLTHPQTTDIIRYAAADKFEYRDVRGDAVAASTIGIETEEYTKWRTDREEFERRF